MPHAQRHRGPNPEDARLFDAKGVEKLRRAAEDTGWLLDRGYAEASVFELVGARYQLEARQRVALRRGVCTTAQYKRHVARELDDEDLLRKPVAIDGFNLLITLEVACSGGLLVQALDGTLRDIAGVSGGYRAVEETDGAIDLAHRVLARLRPAKVEWYLDAPVSNSGRLRARLLERAEITGAPPTAVTLVPSADRVLRSLPRVVTSDSAILDACESWYNLAARAVALVPSPWKIDLG